MTQKNLCKPSVLVDVLREPEYRGGGSKSELMFAMAPSLSVIIGVTFSTAAWSHGGVAPTLSDRLASATGNILSVTLTSSADSWIQDEGGSSWDENFGALDIMIVGGRWSNTYFRALIKFDLSLIPDNATIINAELELYHVMNRVEASNVNNVRLYLLLRNWNEHEGTWSNYAAGLPWTTPGADSIDNDSENIVIAAKSFTSATPVDRYYDFDVTGAVQDNVNGTKPNHGFILVGKETPAANRYFTGFSSRESTSTPPLLIVTYTTQTGNGAPVATVTVDGSVRHQTIDGFGGSDGWLFPPASEYSTLFDDLGVSILRFRMLRYTEGTPDQPGDESSENDNDDPFVINWSGVNTWVFDAYAPYLRAAQSRGVKLIGTIWCPPAWMVSSNTAETADNSFKDGYEEELVEFILIWVKGMERYHSVHIDYVSIQNEPNYGNTTWPTCRYTPRKLRDIIRLLGARFESEGVTTKICSPDVSNLNSFLGGWADTICQDPVARAYVDRLATHSYNEDFWNPDSVISQWVSAWNLASQYNKQLWETEYCNDASRQGTWSEAPVLAQHVHNALVHGRVSAWLAYELYKDPSGSPVALIDGNGPTPKFYSMKQYFRYVRPGAVRIEAACNDPDLMVTAFVHGTENTMTLVIINRDTTAKTINCSLNNLPGVTNLSQFRTSRTEKCVRLGPVNVSGRCFSATLQPDSVTTFTGTIEVTSIHWGEY